ncbi:lytic murein transglycosylase B [Undibacterium cyanobacteriorum]|uniref:Lytic murein transglycosylase B n=1 Tax=Undibacterium cyanobacteriorum TaxID=3073561 RepID=A0ABY9RGM4_9BURK|nr:lytic murein transglycosylase B [Undibacterium sp. 20NA77.5]WMW79377.1 lytic murein transglycosylase B [Undibacterium sp. 20NA77.5]
MNNLRLSLQTKILVQGLLCFVLAFTSTVSYAGKQKKVAHKNSKTVSTVIIGEDRHFNTWDDVQEMKRQLEKENQFSSSEFERIMKQARYVESAVQAVKPMPPGKPKNWKIYRSRFVETARIEAGLRFWQRNESQLKKAEQDFGVPAEIIVGLIGVETIYGKNLGRYRAIDAITTLAFAYPDTPNRETRSAFFRKELTQLLLWARDHQIDPLSVKASYAGAIGLCQFMPTSLREFAVDFDLDGKIDLRDSEADAIGSVGNYLMKHGWKSAVPYVFPATIHTVEPSTNMDASKSDNAIQQFLDRGLKASLRLNELRPFVTTPSADAPNNLLYGLIDLQNGEDPTEYWLATENFYAITQYNRSYFYAMSVIDLAQAISSARMKN